MALKDLLLSGFPEYCESLPSGKEVCFRQMVVSEEKALMLAKTNQDKLTILKTLYTSGLIQGYTVLDSSKVVIYLRKVFNRKPAPEFEQWLKKMGILNSEGELSYSNEDVKKLLNHLS